MNVELAVDRMRVDPPAGPEQVMAPRFPVHGVDAVLPVRPGEPVLRAYALPQPETTIELTGQPLLVVEIALDEHERDQTGWAPAAAIT